MALLNETGLAHLWEHILSKISTVSIPESTTTDNGKVLSVVNGEAAWDELPAGTPDCTTADNGKFLRVVNGAAAWETILIAEEESF